MPSSSSRRAILTLSSTESDRPSRWVPSRKVVSYRNMCVALACFHQGSQKRRHPSYCASGRAAPHPGPADPQPSAATPPPTKSRIEKLLDDRIPPLVVL